MFARLIIKIVARLKRCHLPFNNPLRLCKVSTPRFSKFFGTVTPRSKEDIKQIKKLEHKSATE